MYRQNQHDIDMKSIIFLNCQIENQKSDRQKFLSDSSEHVMVRHEAAEALGAIGNVDAIPILSEFLHDEHIEVSESCEVALDLLNWVHNSSMPE